MTLPETCSLGEPTQPTHHCVGDHGHAGPHWCLLGHVWPAEPQEPLLIPPTTDTKDGAA